jgi:prevent-host-death family protein
MATITLEEAQTRLAELLDPAALREPLIITRQGTNLAAVISLAHLELVREVLARQHVEHLAAQIDWQQVPHPLRPPSQWLADTDNPFEAEEGSS